MSKMPGRLGTLQARDVMCQDVVVLTDTMTLEEATELLKSHKHSGAPVVDCQGKLVGTFSLRDLTGLKDTTTKFERLHPDADSGIVTAEAMNHILENKIEKETVSQRMTRNAPSVTENASLIDVARLMCSFHTHRVPVTTISTELTGIITTMDILAALVHTADELEEADSLPS